jgi:polysaccharide biosynthesis/export protein VpsN
MLAIRAAARVLWLAAFLGTGYLSLLSPAAAAEEAAYRLGAGDKLKVTVYNEGDLSGEYDVNDQGAIALPLIGRLTVAGKTTIETERLITEKYGANYLVDPRVSVEVLNYRPFFIIGEVKNPGSYPFVSGMTVLNAIALAGGYTPRGDQNDILVKRGNDAQAEQRVSENSVVLPGDVIRVKQRFF